jgi:hypothetical protein
MNTYLPSLKLNFMKRILSVITIAAAVTACNPGPRTEDAKVLSSEQKVANTDTLGLADFQAWKAQNELADFKEYQQFKQQSQNNVAYQPQVNRSTSATRKTSRSTSTNTRNYGTTSTSSYPAKKKGWSKAAKGAVIGTAGGAVLGAVINKKNRGVGAVIGGVTGGAVGFGIGRHIDKKDGRY